MVYDIFKDLALMKLEQGVVIGITISFFLTVSIFLFLFFKLRHQQAVLKHQKRGIEFQTRELVSLGEELFDLNEEKNRVLHVLSHDLRNPISQVIGFANLLLQNENELPEDEKKQMLSRIVSASERQLIMIEKLLDISAIEEKRTSINFQTLNLSVLLSRVVESQNIFAESKNIQVELFLSLQDAYAKVDAEYICQIYENLLSNAIKYTPPGKRVSVTMFEENNRIVTSFIDEGPGIKKEDIHKLFKTFSKLSNRPTAGENSIGLGLSLVKSYVRAMGGEVGYAERERGKGAHFFVIFNKEDSLTINS